MKKLAFEFNEEDARLLEHIKSRLESELGKISYMGVIRWLLRHFPVEDSRG